MSPTVRTKYPSSHNSPAHSRFFSDGYSRNSSRALMLFSALTTSPIEYRGGNDKNICTWSFATSISSMSYSYSSAISLKSSDARSRIYSCANRAFLYFGHHTRWYFVSYTAWLVRRSPIRYINMQSPRRERGTSNPPYIPLGKDAIHPRVKTRGILAWLS